MSLVALSFPLLLEGCNSSCSSERVFSYISSDSDVSVILEKKNCGATVGFVYEVFVKQNSRYKNDSVLILRFDNNHQETWPENDLQIISVNKVSSNKISLSFNQPVRVFYSKESVNTISIDIVFYRGTVFL
jgi:hypothetical protein